MRKGFAVWWFIITGFVLIIGSAYWYYVDDIKPKLTGGAACTMEAKQCSDGSYVGRTGPNCEFATCPTVSNLNSNATTSNMDISTWKTYRNEKYGFEMKYPPTEILSVVEQGTNLPEDVVSGKELPSGTQFPTVASIDFFIGSANPVFTVDIYGNKKDSPQNWSDFKNFPSPVRGDYDWDLRPCGQEGFAEIKNKKQTNIAGFRALYLESISEFDQTTDVYYCINYPSNPLIIYFNADKYHLELANQILSTFKFIGTVPQVGTGTLRGQVLLGPTCPVERIPPDPACADKPYQTSIKITNYLGSGAIEEAKSDADGMFTIKLPPGKYDIYANGGNVLPRCAPQTVEIKAGQTAEMKLLCDTGIR